MPHPQPTLLFHLLLTWFHQATLAKKFLVIDDAIIQSGCTSMPGGACETSSEWPPMLP